MALVNDSPRSATAIASEKSLLLSLSKESFMSIFDVNSQGCAEFNDSDPKKFLPSNEEFTEKVGTLYAMAPEVLNGRYSANTADLWTIGVISYALLSDQKLF